MVEEPEGFNDVHSAEVYLQRISRDIKTLLTLVSTGVNYLVNAEAEIPEKMRRFMNYMHDIHDVTYMYEERGIEVPTWILREMERLDDRLRQILQGLHAAGGAFDKVRREMAKDQDNRWDHTKALAYLKKETLDETR